MPAPFAPSINATATYFFFPLPPPHIPAPLRLAGLFTYDVDVEGLTNLRLSQKPVRGCAWFVFAYFNV